MSKSKLKTASNRRRFTEEFKREALLLANRIGIAEASKQLGVGDSQLYYWRSKSKTNSSTTEREQQVLAENARLKRLLVEKEEELAIVKKAAKYFAKELDLYKEKHKKYSLVLPLISAQLLCFNQFFSSQSQ